MGITIALANQGLISYSGAAAFVLGENIGTTVTMELIAKYAIRKGKENVAFSDIASERLSYAYHYMIDYVSHCTVCFSEENEDMLIEAVSKSKSLQKILKNLRKEHLDRLNKKECDIMAGLLYTDILTAFNNIRTHALNIVEATAGLR